VTAYLLAAEAVASAANHAGSSVSVAITRDDQHTAIDLEGEGIVGEGDKRPELEALADRVAALGGRLDVSASPEGREQIRAELPSAGAPA
jgi:signal transduction histidine kinase